MNTISANLAEKLDKLGVKSESMFLWGDGELVTYHNMLGIKTENNYCFLPCELAHAYTLDEILEMLPFSIEKKCYPYYISIEKRSYLYDCGYYEGFDSLETRIARDTTDSVREAYHIKAFKNPNPAQAAGELLAWCIENGYEINPFDYEDAMDSEEYKDMVWGGD